MLAQRSFAPSLLRLIALCALAPMQIHILLCLKFNGWLSDVEVFPMLINTFVLPWIWIPLLGYWIDRHGSRLILLGLRVAVPAICAYGIILFAWKQATGSFIEVPFLTVNAGDVGTLESRHINRGGIFKLISTYNNGNIFGVCLLMLLPFYAIIERARWPYALVAAAIVLTFSRTVWIGAVVFLLLHCIYVMRPSLRTATMLAVGIMISALCFWAIAEYVLGLSTQFFLDPDLGGRAQQFVVLNRLRFLPTQPYDFIGEVLYMGWLDNFGLAGMLLFFLAHGFAPGAHFLGVTPRARSPIGRAAASSVLIYFIVAWSDGIYVNIPGMAIFWFAYSMLLAKRGPEDSDAAARFHERRLV
jgi:hypothetical protein